jgi:hypothetical protein
MFSSVFLGDIAVASEAQAQARWGGIDADYE